MDARELFLDQHASMHSAAVGGNPMSLAERTFGGLSDAQMRVRPREDLNSLAWLLWHIARIEDVFMNPVLSGGPQVFDEAWGKRLGVGRRDVGTGMSSAEVTELTRLVDLGALGEYRDAVGRASREIVGGFGSDDWTGVVAAEGLQRAAAQGAFGDRGETFVKVFTGRPRRSVLSGIGLFHASAHMGEANTIRTAGGFGSGV